MIAEQTEMFEKNVWGQEEEEEVHQVRAPTIRFDHVHISEKCSD